MTDSTPTSETSQASPRRLTRETGTRSVRDAASTRRALVHAARRRFAADGYRATTVRQIAADAGVNVALINRYFVSKEGLFEACVMRTSEELDTHKATDPPDIDSLISSLIGHVVTASDGDDPLVLLLLLRSSGDDGANRIRRKALEHFTRRLSTTAGWDPDDSAALLRAQLAVAAMLGIVTLRTSGVQPVTSASMTDLEEPLRGVLRALLRPTPGSD